MEYNTVVLRKYSQVASESAFNNGSVAAVQWTYDVSTHLHTVKATASQQSVRVIGTKSISVKENHRYAIIVSFIENTFTSGAGSAFHLWLIKDGGFYAVSREFKAILLWNAETTSSNVYAYIDLVGNLRADITAGQKASFYYNLADLTEIYGAGNEPTTVDQFLEDYPEFNGYVPYKENGYFEKKYNTLVGRMSKNLFDISKVISSSNVINNGDGTLTVKDNAVAASSPNTLKDYCPALMPGDTITINADTTAEFVPYVTSRLIYLLGSNRALEFGVSYTITSSDLESNVRFYYDRKNNVPAVISNIMVELGTTATEYEPYGWIEKECNALTLKKYNQLVAKSKLPTSQIREGVMFTNNNDGTISTSGTATGWIELFCGLIETIVIGRKYLGIGSNINGSQNTYCINFSNGVRGFIDTGNGIIFTAQDNERITPYIRFLTGTSANNLVFKPMLVDLTEIYGAGNEPTTVQKFLEDNPEYNDYVPYSEGGWM